jgi:hypothetical protein
MRAKEPNMTHQPRTAAPSTSAGEASNATGAAAGQHDEAANHVYLRALREASAVGSVSRIDAAARAFPALRRAIGAASSDDLADWLVSASTAVHSPLWTQPALTHADLTRKLAVLVGGLLHDDAEDLSPEILRVAASVLVDAVLLQGGPIELPPEPAGA